MEKAKTQHNSRTLVQHQPNKPLELTAFLNGLLDEGRINQSDLEFALNNRHVPEHRGRHPLHYLAELNLPDQHHPSRSLDIETLTQSLACQSGQEYFRIDPLQIDVARVTQIMDCRFSQHHQILAVAERSNEVVIASAEPFINDWETVLAHTSGKNITRVVSNPQTIRRLAAEFYRVSRSIQGAALQGAANQGSSLPAGTDQGTKRGAISWTEGRAKERPKGRSKESSKQRSKERLKEEQSQPAGLANLEQMLELGQLKDPEADDQPIVEVVDWLLQYAFEQRASDIHIEPRRDQGNIRFRVDGLLYTVHSLPMQVLSAVTSRLKILGRMNVAEKRRPQDGRIKTRDPNGTAVELRLATLNTAFGEKLVLRIFNPDVLHKPFAELGLTPDDLVRWNRITSNRHGIIIITGPTGSGKTTTLYSTLKSLATEEVNVCTIEDPIEMVEDSFNQMQVQENIGLGFADGVKALLRQDPDIIMIGEVRDLATAEMAIQSALTGHLVFTTLHTSDAASAITRMLELGVPPYLLKATLVGIMAQRLVRVLCPHCKHPHQISQDDWQSLTAPWKLALHGTDAAVSESCNIPMPTAAEMSKPCKLALPTTAAMADGCLQCRETGFLGREGIFEIMPVTETLLRHVDGQSDLTALRKQAHQEGMFSLRLAGARKVGTGFTTINEVLRVTPDPFFTP